MKKKNEKKKCDIYRHWDIGEVVEDSLVLKREWDMPKVERFQLITGGTSDGNTATYNTATLDTFVGRFSL